MCYYVYSSYDGGRWLHEDEKHWTVRFDEAASFTSRDLASDIANRENTGDMETWILMLCD